MYSTFPHSFSSDSVSVPAYGLESGTLCWRLAAGQVGLFTTVWESTSFDDGGGISGVETVHRNISVSIGSISAALRCGSVS